MGYIHEMREMVGSCCIFVPGVRALIPNTEGEILFQRRTDNALWGLPGGSVERDETVFEALQREVVEETALEVIEAEPMGLYCGPNQKFSYPNGDRVQCFAIAFIVRKWEGEPIADGLEGSCVRFFPVLNLPDPIVAIHRQTLDDYIRYRGRFLLSG